MESLDTIMETPSPLTDPEANLAESSDGGTLDIRIAAIFAILAASCLGGLPPLFIKVWRCTRSIDPCPCDDFYIHHSQRFKNANHPTTLLFRALAAGVILSLALIHVIESGVEMLSVVSDYPVGNCCVVFGVLLMVVLENLSHHFMSTLKTAGTLHACGGSKAALIAHEHVHGGAGTTGKEETVHEGKCGHHDDAGSSIEAEEESREVWLSKTNEITAADGHTHGCVAANTAANCWASQSSQGHGVSVRHQITAYMFELGCVVHSFLVGE